MAVTRKYVAKKTSAKSSVLKGHQKDLARIAGEAAGRRAVKKAAKGSAAIFSNRSGKKKIVGVSIDKAAIAESKGKKKGYKDAMKSFKGTK